MKAFVKRNRIIAAMAAAVVAGHVFGLPYLAVTGWVVLVVTVTSRGLTRYWIRHLDVERSFPASKGNIGDSASGYVAVTNTGWLPIPYVVARDVVDRRAEIEGARAKMGTLLPRRRLSFGYKVTFRNRGYYQFGPAIVETGDLFGLFKKFRAVGQADHALIYPRVLEISRYDIASRRPAGPVRITTRLFEDPLLVASVREYHPGDPLRTIHWKATARTGVLQTKVFEPTRVVGATIVLDFDESRYGTDPIGRAWSELAVTLAASAAWHVYGKREKVGLVTNGADAATRMKFDNAEVETSRRREALDRRGPSARPEPAVGLQVETRRAAEQALRIFEALARIELSTNYPLERLLADFAPRLARDARLVLVTHRVDAELASVLEHVRDGGFLVFVLCVSDGRAYERSRRFLDAVGIDSQVIRDEEDMNEIVIRGL